MLRSLPPTTAPLPTQGAKSKTKGSASSTKRKGWKPSKTIDEDNIMCRRLEGSSTGRYLQASDMYPRGAYNAGCNSDYETEEECASTAGSFTIPAGHYTLAQALEGQAAQVLGEALPRAASMVLEGESMGEEGVMVEVGVGAAAGAGAPKVSDDGSAGPDAWGSSNSSPRISSDDSVLALLGRRASHVAMHTVPKKARRLTEAVVGLGYDISQAADAAAGRLKETSTKIASEVEGAWDRLAHAAQKKADKAAAKTKKWFGNVEAGFKSMFMCGSSNLPVV
jgi:hypothetical protein